MNCLSGLIKEELREEINEIMISKKYNMIVLHE